MDVTRYRIVARFVDYDSHNRYLCESDGGVSFSYTSASIAAVFFYTFEDAHRQFKKSRKKLSTNNALWIEGHYDNKLWCDLAHEMNVIAMTMI